MSEDAAPAPSEGDPYYREFAGAYDDISRGVPGDVEFYVDLCRQARGPVVELGVGTGRIAIPAAQAGARMIGIDCEPSMLAVAEEKARRAGVLDRLTLVEGDMRSFEVAEPVELVTIPFRTFLHNLEVEDQLATLAACRRALRPGGRLVLNIFNPDLALIARWMEKDARHWEPFGAHPGTQGQHTYAPSGQRVTTRLRVRGPDGRWAKTSFHLRYVHREEMEQLLKQSGLMVESLAGGFAGEPYHDASPEMVWQARRVS